MKTADSTCLLNLFHSKETYILLLCFDMATTTESLYLINVGL